MFDKIQSFSHWFIASLWIFTIMLLFESSQCSFAQLLAHEWENRTDAFHNVGTHSYTISNEHKWVSARHWILKDGNIPYLNSCGLNRLEVEACFGMKIRFLNLEWLDWSPMDTLPEEPCSFCKCSSARAKTEAKNCCFETTLRNIRLKYGRQQQVTNSTIPKLKIRQRFTLWIPRTTAWRHCISTSHAYS